MCGIHQAHRPAASVACCGASRRAAAQVVGRPSERHAQVGPADVTDEQRVAGEHRMRLVGRCDRVEDDERNRLGGVPGRFEGTQRTPPIDACRRRASRDERYTRPSRPRPDKSPRRRDPQFEMAGDEIGVKMREEDVLDPQPVVGGKLRY